MRKFCAVVQMFTSVRRSHTHTHKDARYMSVTRRGARKHSNVNLCGRMLCARCTLIWQAAPYTHARSRQYDSGEIRVGRAHKNEPYVGDSSTPTMMRDDIHAILVLCQHS